jgi:DNA-binding response OmpR family regulator
MSQRTIHVLHVEDSRITRQVIAVHLKKIEGFSFAITPVESEEAAVAAFQEAPADLVLLDYHLSEGNGLSCLKRLRHTDRVVPILAISGSASNETAAELLEGGADDFINKADLNSHILGQSVRTALQRADVWRQRRPKSTEAHYDDVKAACRQLLDTFTEEQAKVLVTHLAALDKALANLESRSVEDILRRCGPDLASYVADSARGLLLQRVLRDGLLRSSVKAKSTS